ncbi:Hypothetical protein SMAX5B_017013 [Scophthalmus maximus]|uniref:Uncharacterized protein n=1 Tax=Scophthalmus maximus TaxID=52904 RepID=A0A2U9B9R5_SCOMX|nr:Hypothetical protein SMAX5B_017013 [Scophthalmus maximus]
MATMWTLSRSVAPVWAAANQRRLRRSGRRDAGRVCESESDRGIGECESSGGESGQRSHISRRAGTYPQANGDRGFSFKRILAD